MANFISQSQQYDAQEIEAKISDLQNELQDEMSVKDHLDLKSSEKIVAAQKFMADHAERIDDQLSRMKDLDLKIREAVLVNEELQEQDDTYSALITSSPYMEIAEKIASLHSISAELVDFLVKRGRRGRLPLN
jgi:hypothetical protein